MKKGEDIVRDVFGALLSSQGRGFYVGLELMALLRGTLEHDDSILPSPTTEPLQVLVRSHDFARRLMGEPRYVSREELEGIEGELALDVLAALGRGLRVPVPGRRTRLPWYAEHFQPFVGELIHYDAVFRPGGKQPVVTVGDKGKRISVEQYLYRGAGGLAHALLRSDPDAQRLERNRAALRRLVQNSGTPIGELFAALSLRDKGAGKRFTEEREHKCLTRIDVHSKWADLLRDGVLRIAERSLPRAKIAEALMYWVPYCIARYQSELAFRELGAEPRAIPVDLGSGAGPIRRRSREVHERTRSSIVAALDQRAAQDAPDVLEKRRTTTWREGARGFYSGTLAAVGALNAHTGKRHFVLGNEILEAIVMSQVEEEISFEDFCRNVLFGRLGLVVDRASSAQCHDLEQLNRSDFDSNADVLAVRLETLGMLVKYSDHTRMVSGGVGQ